MDNSRKSSGHSHTPRPQHKPHNRFKREHSVAQEIMYHSSRRLAKISRFGLLMLAFFGGGLMTLGVYFGVVLSGGLNSAALESLSLALGISTGLFLVVSSNSILFTEANVMVPANLYTNTIGQAFSRLTLFWLLAFIGNILGAWFISWIINYSIGFSSTAAEYLKEMALTKLQHKANGNVLGMFDLILSGIMANWVIAFSVLYAIYNRAAMGKIMILFVTSALIIAANFQYFPLNTSVFSLFHVLGEGPGWMQILVYNLLPVAIGNLIGAAFFVSLPLLLQSQRPQQRGQQ